MYFYDCTRIRSSANAFTYLSGLPNIWAMRFECLCAYLPTFKETLREILVGHLKGNFQGHFKLHFKGHSKGNLKGHFKGHFKGFWRTFLGIFTGHFHGNFKGNFSCCNCHFTVARLFTISNFQVIFFNLHTYIHTFKNSWLLLRPNKIKSTYIVCILLPFLSK